MIPRAHFHGIVYRAHHPMWAYTPLSGEGAKQHGGRFNRPGCSEANRNLVLWQWSTAKPHAIEAIDNLNRLPNNQASWAV